MRYLFLVIISFLYAADNDAPSNRTRDREIDVHHIKIDVSVDIEAGSVYGHVVHTFSPLSSSLVSFELDADDMNIRRVRMKNKDIKFDHSGGKLYIRMDKAIGWNDTVSVRVDYTSFPTVGTFFIRPDET